MGGGVAAALAQCRAPAAMILESTFTSVSSFAWKFGVPPFLCRDPFRTDRVLPTLGTPVLILHGADDTIIPARHGRRLHELAPGSEYKEMAGGHNDFPRDRGEYESVVREFLRSAGIGSE